MTAAKPCDPVQKIGPGRLVLVVGPSGAGKDTLIELARVALEKDRRIIFARRVVTRESSSFERNEYMPCCEFDAALARNEFTVSWSAHGHDYGLRSSLDRDIAAGLTVVANVSRSVIVRLRETYENVMVVEVTAPVEILAARLAQRGRLSDGDLQSRLRRAGGPEPLVPDLVLHNVGAVQGHADELCRVLRPNSSPIKDSDA